VDYHNCITVATVHNVRAFVVHNLQIQFLSLCLNCLVRPKTLDIGLCSYLSKPVWEQYVYMLHSYLKHKMGSYFEVIVVKIWLIDVLRNIICGCHTYD
jgi:membrane-associated PAP2 superfamily phosphatase